MPFPELFRDDVFRIETRRLWLRWPRAADARALQQIAGLAEVAEMTATWPHPLPDNEADWRILRARESNADGSSLILAITRKKAPDQLIGNIGVSEIAEGQLGLGYMLDPAWHSRGIMTEAVAGLTAAVFTGSRHGLIRASCQVVNKASRQVLENAGFAYVGQSMLDAPARGSPIEVDDFELDRAAWFRAAAVARNASHTPGFDPARAA